ncbi:TIGR04086 family membrane protein [Metallumcola ferriviriculae]|uniref:TIGR04086 family membrane protein n=1 Tax=Metallumcola ferriviriculae TaxID=3039180 RepID=A0AAU0UM32_9FIRM|nr:TIGR04086 family membrane protein [Desulfitibacteraceae bacterium MK1]
MAGTNFKAIWKGFWMGAAILIGGYTLLLLWVLFGSRQSYYLPGYMRVIVFLALVMAGFSGGKAARWQGWKHGGWIGAAVALAAVAINAALIPQIVSVNQVVYKLLVGAVTGGAAAVCGVNIAFLQRRGRLGKGNKDKSLY